MVKTKIIVLIYFFSATTLQQLQKELTRTHKSAFAPGSVKNLKCQLKKFVKFVELVEQDCFPITVYNLCLYIQFLSCSLSSPQSIRNYVSGLKTIHLLCNVPFPDTSNMFVKLTFKGIDKRLQHVPRRASPMTPHILAQLYELMDFSVIEHIVMWCLFLFLFFLFSRKSQFMCQNLSDPHRVKVVKRGHIYVHEGSLCVKFVWTKTRQSGGDPLVVPLAPIPGSKLCPVSAYINMIKSVPASCLSPAFILPSSTGLGPHPVLYDRFHIVLREFVSVLGLDPRNYSSHSFRRGGASFAFSVGVPGELIQRHGDWRSDAYKLYLDTTVSQRLLVSRAMANNVP